MGEKQPGGGFSIQGRCSFSETVGEEQKRRVLYCIRFADTHWHEGERGEEWARQGLAFSDVPSPHDRDGRAVRGVESVVPPRGASHARADSDMVHMLIEMRSSVILHFTVRKTGVQ